MQLLYVKNFLKKIFYLFKIFKTIILIEIKVQEQLP